ncbi:ATP-binding membrane protein [Beutenbergia cavernae DSM 12333]|uniref:ATP-binding membrane protein n=1 Tax=Beutenbergia cavernae (strain ATCC BAA-8 / DSM 12333 / CCUG 43141 / JCM 11478 / NBRC 16432 / NCIMB 13614 / HKI 0122) TaxID=471853 RepID=C5BXK6_BEUC1|nr:GTPase [Beutenbergia cavernae]ACQ80889.1 ATP-binding membrane protein [Beutenbergia cavernae DSM 12333]
MSTTTTTEEGRRLRARLDELHEILAATRVRLAPDVVARTERDLAGIATRLDLGVDHTVVALVGGTGSGKSSLFNAVSQLEFADVGAKRPTTAQASACVWGEPADALLDFLEVAPTRRIGRESALDADEQAELRGLVLLDLPDHDSIEVGHARQVDRLLPLVDLLVWVVDPQKYADNALHDAYLRELAARQDAMLVVVNQSDTLTPAAFDEVRADVERLLAADGLDEVSVLGASARTGDGVAAVRAVLAEVVARRTMAERTASAEAGAVARRMLAALGAKPREAESAAHVADRLGAVLGVPALASSVAAAHASGGVVLTDVRAPSLARVAAVREAWLARATDGLPDAWAREVRSAVAGPESLRDAASAALADVVVPRPPERGWLARQRRARNEREGAEAAVAYRDAAQRALTRVVADRLVDPAQRVLGELARARTALTSDAHGLSPATAPPASG